MRFQITSRKLPSGCSSTGKAKKGAYVPHRHSIPIEVRFADLDAYGHVNGSVYFTYLETARVRMFTDAF
ncbi:MAG: acyl-CoA thioesterase, partial [Geobacteraceae bacterium]|nr:acyl-CoA thioesterase [Geobacteraceae bacterium]